MEWYDTKRLFADADARIIVKALFSKNDFRQAGSTLFCRCPGGHKETRLEHCAVYKTGCKCFSCGNHYGLREMLESYFKDDNFSELCGRIADVMGGRDLYLTSRTGSPQARKKELPFTGAELEIIGLYSPENIPDVPKLSSLYKDDPEACKAYVRNRAKAFLSRYDYLKQNEENQDLREEFERRYRITRQLYERLGGVIDTVPRMFKL